MWEGVSSIETCEGFGVQSAFSTPLRSVLVRPCSQAWSRRSQLGYVWRFNVFIVLTDAGCQLCAGVQAMERLSGMKLN